MKLRLQGNSVRLRLTRSEIERLRDTGLVQESADFGGGEVFAYRPGSDEVGIYAQATAKWTVWASCG